MSGARGSRASGGAKPGSATERSGEAVSIVGDSGFIEQGSKATGAKSFTKLKYLLDTTQAFARHSSSNYLISLEYLLYTARVLT